MGKKYPLLARTIGKVTLLRYSKLFIKFIRIRWTRRLPKRLMRVSDRVSYLRLGPVLNPSSKMAQISTNCAGASSKMFDGLANCNP
jgi:hypothetical protein